MVCNLCTAMRELHFAVSLLEHCHVQFNRTDFYKTTNVWSQHYKSVQKIRCSTLTTSSGKMRRNVNREKLLQIMCFPIQLSEFLCRVIHYGATQFMFSVVKNLRRSCQADMTAKWGMFPGWAEVVVSRHGYHRKHVSNGTPTTSELSCHKIPRCFNSFSFFVLRKKYFYLI